MSCGQCGKEGAEMNKIGETINKKRTELGLTQSQLAGILNVSFQSVSKWENGSTYPDIEKLPELAAALKTTVDALLGYKGAAADYDNRYAAKDYYWGLRPNRLCFEIMQLLPPVKPYHVLDIGCGEGKDAVFLAKCGYIVTAFDISETGIEKAKRLAEHNCVHVDFRKVDVMDFPFDRDYDIIFSSGVLHFIRPAYREELCARLKTHTTPNGFNVLNVFVQKPFIVRASDGIRDESLRSPWRSGELFGYYHDWLFHVCREDIFDCMSGGTPHKHCMDSLIAEKLGAGEVL